MSVLGPFVVETAIITYRAVGSKSTVESPIPFAPVPSQYVSAGLIYAALALLPGNLGPLIGWGFVVATLLNLWTPGGKIATTTPSTTTTGATT
jgi:hypothetical protein